MNLGETLRKLIKDNINTTRPFFGYVIEQNADRTWVIQPIDDQPVVNNVQTFQTEVDGNDPIIGSLVLCIFIDDYNSFITEIIEYDTWFVNAETSSTVYSANNTLIAGKRLILLGEEKTVDEVKDIVDAIENNGDTGILLESKNIRIDAKDNDSLVQINSDKNIVMYGTEQISLVSKDINLTANSVEFGTMLANIGNSLKDIQTSLIAINTVFIGTGTPTPLSTIAIGVIDPIVLTNLSTEISTLVTDINLWNQY